MGQNNGVEYLGTWACRVLDVAWKRIANMLQEDWSPNRNEIEPLIRRQHVKQ